MNENEISYFIDKALNSVNETELINLLHHQLSKKFDIFESNFFVFDKFKNLSLIVNSGTSNTLQNNIQTFEEDGIIDFAIIQGKCLIVPNLTGESSSVNSYIFVPFIFHYNQFIYSALSTFNLSDFNESAKEYINRIVSIAGLCLNSLMLNRELILSTNQTKELNSKMIDAGKFASLGELTNSILVEFSNPLQIAGANLELINSGIGDSVRRLQIINEQIKLLNGVYHRLTSLLSFNLKESVLEEVDIISLVNGIVVISSNKLKKEDISIEKETDLKEAIIYGYKNQLEQILINLIENSKSTMPDGGFIKIGIYKYLKNKINLIISDNGVGFSDIEISTLFDINFEKKSKGLLGLFYIKEIIKEHNGKIIVNSEIAKGTTYRITLPAQMVK